MKRTVHEGKKGKKILTVLNDIATAKVMPYEMAERIAEANNKDDPEWEYIVERVKYNKHYPTAVIRVHDEDGRCLGWL